MSSSRRILQNSFKNVQRRTLSTGTSNGTSKNATAAATTLHSNSHSGNAKFVQFSILSAGIVTLLTASAASSSDTNTNHNHNTNTNNTTFCENRRRLSGDVVMLGPTKEASTGILFPHFCNGMQFVGCGVRVKYGFVKVYAVGTYMDPLSMAAVKSQGPKAVAEALLNPAYPRTIRIVMNRNLSIDKYMTAILEALEPRMNGEDLDKLEEFKKMNPLIDLVEGAEMEMTIRGNTMLYKNSVGGVGQIESSVFCKALCDVYYGKEAVSPGHKEQVVKGVANL